MSRINYKLRGAAMREENLTRRSGFDIKTREIKLDSSHLSKNQAAVLSRWFAEAKWIYNFALAHELKFDTKAKDVEVMVLGKPEIRKLTLPAQMKQGILQRLIANAKSLKSRKKAGHKIGKLKFVSEINVLPLKQYGVSYRVNAKSVRISGLGTIRANGCSQLGCEKTSATLIRKPSGYYLKVVIYTSKSPSAVDRQIGLDFGIKDSITTSDGEKLLWNLESKRLKTLHRAISRKVKGSRNRERAKRLIKREYEKVARRKDDAANKFIASLKGAQVFFQDENIAGWKANSGKRLQNDILGRIKGRLKRLPTAVMLDRFLPTTKFSPISLKNVDVPRSSRLFQDGAFEMDRDIKAAKTALAFGKLGILTRKELMGKPVERMTAVFTDLFGGYKLTATKQEATVL